MHQVVRWKGQFRYLSIRFMICYRSTMMFEIGEKEMLILHMDLKWE